MLLIPAFVILVVYGELGWALVVFVTAGVTDAARRPHRAAVGAEDHARRVARSDGRQAAAGQHVRRADAAGARPREPAADLADGADHQPRRRASCVTVAIVNLAIGRRTFRPSMFGKIATAHLHRDRRGGDAVQLPRLPLADRRLRACTPRWRSRCVSGFHYIWHAARIIEAPEPIAHDC